MPGLPNRLQRLCLIILNNYIVFIDLNSTEEYMAEGKTNVQKQNQPYSRVMQLITHIDNLENQDLFQYVVTAALLTTYLDKRTNFFDSCIPSEINRSVGINSNIIDSIFLGDINFIVIHILDY